MLIKFTLSNIQEPVGAYSNHPLLRCATFLSSLLRSQEQRDEITDTRGDIEYVPDILTWYSSVE